MMKRQFKRGLLVVIMVAMIAAFIGEGSASEAATITKNGFSYDSSVYSVSWQKARVYYVYGERASVANANNCLGEYRLIVGVLRQKGTEDCKIMIRSVMTPGVVRQDKYCYSKSKGIYYEDRFGLSEALWVRAALPSALGDYQPKNEPKTDHISLSLGVSASEGPSLGFSYDVEIDDIDITPQTNTGKGWLENNYDYIPSTLRWWVDNDYVAHESVQLSMAEFENAASRIRFSVLFEAEFGAASNAERSPKSIEKSFKRRTGGSAIFTLTLQ